MELQKLIQAKEVFFAHIQEKISPRLAYKIMKFVTAIEVEETFFNNSMKKIVEEFSEKNENGSPCQVEGGIKIAENKQPECESAILELKKTEVAAPDIKFTLEELEQIKLSVVDIAIIIDFVVGE